jgi:hypothetical protein
MGRQETLQRYNAKPEVKAKKLAWYHDNKDKVSEQVALRRKADPHRFRLNALRYYYRKYFGLNEIPKKEPCLLCNSTYRMHLHHRDGNNGRNDKPLNNDKSNLVWLCNPCHTRVHNHGQIRIMV